MPCPNCRAVMTSVTLEGHYGRPVTIDYCRSCQAFWFDGHESLQLSAGSVVLLFRIVSDAGGDARAPLSGDVACPRCGVPLVATQDQQRQSKFEYRRCASGHGRLVTFFNFLREKDFIRPMSKAQLDELRRNLESVNCSNCGAPIDLARASACQHCGSPLSMLDVRQAGRLVDTLRKDSEKTREVQAAFAAFEREPGWYGSASRQGLVTAAIAAFTKWLRE